MGRAHGQALNRPSTRSRRGVKLMMTRRRIEPLAVASADGQESLLRGLLADTLEWPIPDDIDDLHDLAYGRTEEDLRAQGLERHLLDGHVWQVKLRDGQPWGIFIIEFAHGNVFRTVL